MVPVIALVGRPNVGKSTLFNRLTRSRDALVANFPGLTRDRKYGQAEFNGYNLDIRDNRVKPLTQWVEDFFPDVSTEHCVPWAGLRPMMPSMLPKVGPGKKPGVFYNTGHGHLGWTLSAATAEAVADCVEVARARNDRAA